MTAVCVIKHEFRTENKMVGVTNLAHWDLSVVSADTDMLFSTLFLFTLVSVVQKVDRAIK